MLEWVSLMGPDASAAAEWTYQKCTHAHDTVMLRNVQYSPLIAYKINTTLSSCSGLCLLFYSHLSSPSHKHAVHWKSHSISSACVKNVWFSAWVMQNPPLYHVFSCSTFHLASVATLIDTVQAYHWERLSWSFYLGSTSFCVLMVPHVCLEHRTCWILNCKS